MDYYAWISKLLRNVAFSWRPKELSCWFYRWLIAGNLAIWTVPVVLKKVLFAGCSLVPCLFQTSAVVNFHFFVSKVGKRVELVLFETLRKFLSIALRISTAHDFRVMSARTWARARAKHGGFAWALSVEKWLQRTNEHGHPNFFSSHCNQLIINFVWGKTNLISIAENWINNENRK